MAQGAQAICVYYVVAGRSAGSPFVGPLGSAALVARRGGAGGGDAVAGKVGRSDAWRTGTG